jgi:cysteine-rich repeat protein
MTWYRGLRAAIAAFALLVLEPLAAAQLVINEVDYDQPSTDTAEFIEIANTGGAPVNLDTWSIELVGGDGNVYDTIDLPDLELAAGDYYVVCGDPANVPSCDLDDDTDSNFIQNGSPDALRLLDGAVVQDAVSYEGSVAGAVEGTGDSGDSDQPLLAMARFPDGVDSGDNEADFSVRCITPGAANGAAASLCSCGDGTVDDGESCDDGGANGTTECGCTSSCEYVAASEPCGSQEPGVCDEPDICDGAGACDPNPTPEGGACGSGEDTDCTDADSCDQFGNCVSNDEGDGVACGDQSDTDCTDPDTCSGGECAPNHQAPDSPCGDSTDSECSDPDTCDTSGVCVPNHATPGTGCGDDGDGDCSNPDQCDGSGACAPNDEPDGTSCADDEFCDGAEICMDAECVDAAVPCADGEFCDEDGELCTGVCGNGIVTGDEACDDENDADDDGCSGCAIDIGWVCGDDEPIDGVSDCYQSCGDGDLDLYESCDDDNVDPGDGCTGNCQVEAGWECEGEEQGGDLCAPLCGDGMLVGDEPCDDGNLAVEDGCNRCVVEEGWECDDSEPSECVQHPDDGSCGCQSSGLGGGTLGLLFLFLAIGRLRRR